MKFSWNSFQRLIKLRAFPLVGNWEFWGNFKYNFCLKFFWENDVREQSRIIWFFIPYHKNLIYISWLKKINIKLWNCSWIIYTHIHWNFDRICNSVRKRQKTGLCRTQNIEKKHKIWKKEVKLNKNFVSVG